jgi:hypothetical protein
VAWLARPGPICTGYVYSNGASYHENACRYFAFDFGCLG